MEFTHKIPSVEAYNQLRVNAGMNSTKPHSEVKKALEGTLFLVSVYEDDELIGLGRIVGDGGVTFVVSDIMVDKNKILDIIEEISEDDSFREDLDVDLLDLGILDSLGMVTLIIALEKNFSIKLPITEINVEDVNTPNKIIKLVEGKVNNG